MLIMRVTTGLVINIILLLILLGIVGNEIYLRIMGRRSAKLIAQDEFTEGMRKAQVIDVREKEEFNRGHVLGARSIPFSTLKVSMASIRKDQPVYLYDQKRAVSLRAANKLRKEGYKNIYILKDGYAKWTGKIKKKNL